MWQVIYTDAQTNFCRARTQKFLGRDGKLRPSNHAANKSSVRAGRAKVERRVAGVHTRTHEGFWAPPPPFSIMTKQFHMPRSDTVDRETPPREQQRQIMGCPRDGRRDLLSLTKHGTVGVETKTSSCLFGPLWCTVCKIDSNRGAFSIPAYF